MTSHSTVENQEPCQELLTDRLARGPMPLAEAMQVATQIAGALRDLHRNGMAYGAVSLQLVLLGSAGAQLRSAGSPPRLGDGRADVAAFGALLEELLRHADGPDHLREQAQVGLIPPCHWFQFFTVSQAVYGVFVNCR